MFFSTNIAVVTSATKGRLVYVSIYIAKTTVTVITNLTFIRKTS